MKRFLVVILALTALLALVAVGADAKKKVKRVSTSTTITFSGTADPYGEFTNGSFSGKIQSSTKCKGNRSVTVQKVGGALVGSSTSSSDGDWTVGSTAPLAAGQYQATVAKKKYKKKKKLPDGTFKKKKTVCKQGTATITIP